MDFRQPPKLPPPALSFAATPKKIYSGMADIDTTAGTTIAR
jgi:hypothetical protein